MYLRSSLPRIYLLENGKIRKSIKKLLRARNSIEGTRKYWMLTLLVFGVAYCNAYVAYIHKLHKKGVTWPAGLKYFLKQLL